MRPISACVHFRSSFPLTRPGHNVAPRLASPPWRTHSVLGVALHPRQHVISGLHATGLKEQLEITISLAFRDASLILCGLVEMSTLSDVWANFDAIQHSLDLKEVSEVRNQLSSDIICMYIDLHNYTSRWHPTLWHSTMPSRFCLVTLAP